MYCPRQSRLIRCNGLLIAAATCLATIQAAPSETVKLALEQKLPNVPGQTLSGVLVTYPPGGKSVQHHHSGSVLACVLTGAIRSENSATGPAKV